MNTVILQFVKTLVLAVVGSAITYVALVWLGMGRHGRTDWGFLHLDWVFQPHLSYWGRHMRNLLWLNIGVFLCLWSLKSLCYGFYFYREYSIQKK